MSHDKWYFCCSHNNKICHRKTMRETWKYHNLNFDIKCVNIYVCAAFLRFNLFFAMTIKISFLKREINSVAYVDFNRIQAHINKSHGRRTWGRKKHTHRTSCCSRKFAFLWLLLQIHWLINNKSTHAHSASTPLRVEMRWTIEKKILHK